MEEKWISGQLGWFTRHYIVTDLTWEDVDKDLEFLESKRIEEETELANTQQIRG